MSSELNIFATLSGEEKVKAKKSQKSEKHQTGSCSSEERKKRKSETSDGSVEPKKKKPKVSVSRFDSTFLPLVDPEACISAFQPTFQRKKGVKKDGKSPKIISPAPSPIQKKAEKSPKTKEKTPKRETTPVESKPSPVPTPFKKPLVPEEKSKQHEVAKRKDSEERKDKKQPIDWSKCPNCKLHKEAAAKLKDIKPEIPAIQLPDYPKLEQSAEKAVSPAISKASESAHLLAKLSRAATVLEATQKKLVELQKERDEAIDSRNKMTNAAKNFLDGYLQNFQEAQEGMEDLQAGHLRFLREISSKHKQEKEMVQAVVKICQHDKQKMRSKLNQRKEEINELRQSLVEETKRCEEHKEKVKEADEKIKSLQLELKSKPTVDPNAPCSNCKSHKRLQEVLEAQLEQKNTEVKDLRKAREDIENKVGEKDRIMRILTKDGERLKFELRTTKKECERQLERAKSEWDHELESAMREVAEECEKKIAGASHKIPSPPISDKSDAGLPLTKAEMENELASVFQSLPKPPPEKPPAIPDQPDSSGKSCSTIPTTSSTSANNPFTSWGANRPASQERKPQLKLEEPPPPTRSVECRTPKTSTDNQAGEVSKKRPSSFAWGSKLSDAAKTELRSKLRLTLTKTIRASMDHPEARPGQKDEKGSAERLKAVEVESEEDIAEPLKTRRCDVSWLRWQLDSSDDLISWYRGEVKCLTEALWYYQSSLEDAQMAIEEDLVPSVNLDMKEAELAVTMEKLRKEQDLKATLQKELESKSAYAEMLRGNLLALSDSVNEFIGANGTGPSSSLGASSNTPSVQGPSSNPLFAPSGISNTNPPPAPFGSHCAATPSPFINPPRF